MSHPQPPQRQPTTDETQKYLNVLHNTAIVVLVACPALALLPPRKFDAYTFGLGGATLFSANYLIREQTGRSPWQHITGRPPQPILHTPMQSGGMQIAEQEVLKQELRNADYQDMKKLQEERPPSVTEQVQSQRDAWKAERKKEIEEDIENGKTFQDMIVDQIWEVWNWGKTDDDDN